MIPYHLGSRLPVCLPGELDIIKVGSTGLILTRPSMQKFKPISIALAKKVKLPRATKVSSSPVTIKHKGNCYQFGCQQGKECKDCKLFWFDRNKDGKVQPRRELRCGCTVGKQCRVRVRKIDCK